MSLCYNDIVLNIEFSFMGELFMNYKYRFIDSIDGKALDNFYTFIDTFPEIENLTIEINSVGGITSIGVTIYNLLKSLPCKIHTHNLGEVSSAALLIYLAGDTRTAEDISKFMIHPIKMTLNDTLLRCQINEILQSLSLDIENYATIVNKETQKLKGVYDTNYYLNYESLHLNKEKALACGIVTE